MASEKSSTGILVSPILIGTVFIFTIFSSRVSGSAANALQLCGTSVIPSLFPFMVLSSMAVSVAAHIKSPSVRWTIVIILGLLCGLPVGVSALCHGVDDGQMNRNSGALVPILFATASPSFIVDVIGKSFWGSRELGWIFYFCQTSSFAFVYWWFSAVSSFFHKGFYTNADNTSSSLFPESGGFEKLCRTFTSAVGNSAVTVIRICGFIVFFRVVCDLSSSIFQSPLFYAIIASVLEFTSGTAASASLGGDLGIFICGTAIGFSGLSVMAQCGEILSKSSVSIKPLFLARLISAPICGGLSLFLYRVLEIPTAVFSVTKSLSSIPSLFSILTIFVFLLSLLFICLKKVVKSSVKFHK